MLKQYNTAICIMCLFLFVNSERWFAISHEHLSQPLYLRSRIHSGGQETQLSVFFLSFFFLGGFICCSVIHCPFRFAFVRCIDFVHSYTHTLRHNPVTANVRMSATGHTRFIYVPVEGPFGTFIVPLIISERWRIQVVELCNATAHG